MARLGKMINKDIYSNFLQEEKQVKVYLPETFDNLNETKCCFMQDGDDYFQMGRVATLSDKLHENGTLQNTVFIGIHYENREDRQEKYHPSGSEYEDYQRFLIEEVLPMVDDMVPINPLGTMRSLMGDSLAGTFAIVTALHYSNYFSQVIMQSPLIDDTVLSTIKEAGVQNLSIYHSIGLDETAVFTTKKEEVDFVDPNKKAAKYFNHYFHDYVYTEIVEGNHTWKYWQKELPEVLEDMLG